MSSADGEILKNEKLPIKEQFLTIYRNLRLVFLKGGQKNFGFMIFAVLLINALGGALGSIYNIFFLSHSLLDFSYTEALFISQFCALLAIIISSLTGNDYFGKQSLPRLMMWVTVGLSLIGLAIYSIKSYLVYYFSVQLCMCLVKFNQRLVPCS